MHEYRLYGNQSLLTAMNDNSQMTGDRKTSLSAFKGILEIVSFYGVVLVTVKFTGCYDINECFQ